MKNNRILALLLAWVLVLPMFSHYSPSYAADEASLVGITILESYEVGTQLKIGDGKIAVNSNQLNTSVELTMPDGSLFGGSTITLNAVGKYSLLYSAVDGGTVHTVAKEFSVYPPLLTTTSKSDRIEYGTDNRSTPVSGIKTELSLGSVVTCNEIVDLRNLGRDNNFISFFVTPETLGVLEFTTVVITLVDVYDETNFVTIKVKQSQYGDGCAYIGTRASNQSWFVGYEHGTHYYYGEPHGYAARTSFYGTDIGKPSYKVGLSYDVSTNRLYSINPIYDQPANPVPHNPSDANPDHFDPFYIVNYASTEAFDEVWNGFTTGEVYVKVSGDGYYRAKGNIIITSIGDVNLQSSLASTIAPIDLTVDFGDYTQGTHPDALINKPYKIFPASVKEKYGLEKVVTRVFYGYGTSSQLVSNISSGTFTPNRTGQYTIEYKATDRFGYTKIKTVEVRSVATAPAVSLVLDGTGATTGYAGEEVVVSGVTASGGLGNVTTSIVAKNLASGTEIEVLNGRFKPLEAGTFTIIYTAEDYVTQTETIQYEVVVTARQTPIFESEPILPRYLIKGGRYTLPQLVAYDYYSGTRRAVNCTVSATDFGGTTTVTGEYVPSIAGERGTATITYTALSSSGLSDHRSFDIEVIDTGLGTNAIVLPNYFKASAGMTVSAVSNSISVKSTSSNATAEFIKPLLFDGFNLTFQIPQSNSTATSLDFYLADTYNPDNQIKISLVKNGTSAEICINNGVRYATGRTFGGGTIDFYLSVSNNRVTLGDANAPINTYLNGKPFDGLQSGFVNLTVGSSGSSVDLLLQIKNLNGQPLSAVVTKDVIAPNLRFMGSYGGQYVLNERLSLSGAEAIDVLDPYASITLTVRTPSGAYAVSEDGVTLNAVIPNREFSVELTSYGNYSVSYNYIDGAGIDDRFVYVASCVDRIAPTIQLSSASASVAVGSRVSVPTALVSDNLTEQTKLVVQKYLLTPQNQMLVLSDNSFTAELNGVYTVKFLVIDEYKNISIADFVVTVGSGNADDGNSGGGSDSDNSGGCGAITNGNGLDGFVMFMGFVMGLLGLCMLIKRSRAVIRRAR